MYKVVKNYGGTIIEEECKSESECRSIWGGWYQHGLDMYGQVVPNTFKVFDSKGNIVLEDRI